MFDAKIENNESGFRNVISAVGASVKVLNEKVEVNDASCKGMLNTVGVSMSTTQAGLLEANGDMADMSATFDDLHRHVDEKYSKLAAAISASPDSAAAAAAATAAPAQAG